MSSVLDQFDGKFVIKSVAGQPKVFAPGELTSDNHVLYTTLAILDSEREAQVWMIGYTHARETDLIRLLWASRANETPLLRLAAAIQRYRDTPSYDFNKTYQDYVLPALDALPDEIQKITKKNHLCQGGSEYSNYCIGCERAMNE